MELAVLDMIQKIHTPVLDTLMVYITRLGDGGFIWILLALLLLFWKQTRKEGFWMFVVLLLGLVVGNLLLKNLIGRPRPFLENPGIALLIPPPGGYSFPSCHTLSSFGAASFGYLTNPKWGRAALALAFLIGISRLYLYVHYPSDVLAGAAVGAGLGFLVKKAEERWWPENP